MSSPKILPRLLIAVGASAIAAIGIGIGIAEYRSSERKQMCLSYENQVKGLYKDDLAAMKSYYSLISTTNGNGWVTLSLMPRIQEESQKTYAIAEKINGLKQALVRHCGKGSYDNILWSSDMQQISQQRKLFSDSAENLKRRFGYR